MILAILIACGLLTLGVLLRVNVWLLRFLFVPAAVVGGFVGLLLHQLVPASIAEQSWYAQSYATLGSWPGHLIAIVFAGLFLERKSRSLRNAARLACREGIVVWIIVLGQTTVGLLATWLLIQPFYDVPNSFGMLIETGFAGGHGTAAAMGRVYDTEAVQMSYGLDLGMTMATIGLVASVTTGILYVNLAVRRGWVNAGEVQVDLIHGLEHRHDPPTIARAPVRAEVIEPMVLQISLLGLGYGLGLLQQWLVARGIVAAATIVSSEPQVWLDSNNWTAQLLSAVGDFPLFIYTLFGGLIVRRTMSLFGIEDLIDSLSIQRLVGIAMEFLVVAAIATLNLQVVVDYFWPLVTLTVVGLIWTGFCLLVVSRWFLPRGYWFELGVLNYGMSTGTTATGFVLLRIIDRDLDSGAAEDYAFAAPLSAPFVGGGMLTLALPVLVLERIPIAASVAGLSAAVAVCFAIAWFLSRERKSSDSLG